MNTNNFVIVGRKSLVNYILYAFQVLREFGDCIVRARGKNLYKAIGVAEILKNKVDTRIQYSDMRLFTETIEIKGVKKNLSCVEIKIIHPLRKEELQDEYRHQLKSELRSKPWKEFELRYCYNENCSKKLFYDFNMPEELWENTKVKLFCCNCYRYLINNFPDGNIDDLANFSIEKKNKSLERFK